MLYTFPVQGLDGVTRIVHISQLDRPSQPLQRRLPLSVNLRPCGPATLRAGTVELANSDGCRPPQPWPLEEIVIFQDQSTT